MLSDLWCIARSQENLLKFYQEELTQTLKDPSIKPDIPKSATRTLKRAGDLMVERGFRGTFYRLSPRATRILQDLEAVKTI